VHGAAVDSAMALSWIPFAALGAWWQGDGDRLPWLVSATLLLSFFHQPLTVVLVYGDRRTFDMRRALFAWAPLVLTIGVLLGMHLSLAALAVVAGLWNAEHTLMQRYGISRIYGRKAGQAEGGRERAMLVSWLVLAAIWVAADADTPDRIAAMGVGGHNRRSLELLTDLRPVAQVLVPLAILGAALLTARWLDEERGRGDGANDANDAKRLYLASTAALFLTILVHPVAGFLGYVGSHAVEYFVIVHHSLGARYSNSSGDGDGGAALGRVVRRFKRLGSMAVYLTAVGLAVAAVDRYGSVAFHTAVLLVLGAVHLCFDGFIWKRPPAPATA
jgi:hypothetical protein